MSHHFADAPNFCDGQVSPNSGALATIRQLLAAVMRSWTGLVRARHRALLLSVDGETLGLFGLNRADLRA